MIERVPKAWLDRHVVVLYPQEITSEVLPVRQMFDQPGLYHHTPMTLITVQW